MERKKVTPQDIRNIVEEANPDALFLENKFDKALLGYGKQCGGNFVAVYDASKCLEILIKKEKMGEIEAYEHYVSTTKNMNAEGNHPIFITDFRKMLVPSSEELKQVIEQLGS
jgi:hypothetical protein